MSVIDWIKSIIFIYIIVVQFLLIQKWWKEKIVPWKLLLWVYVHLFKSYMELFLSQYIYAGVSNLNMSFYGPANYFVIVVFVLTYFHINYESLTCSCCGGGGCCSYCCWWNGIFSRSTLIHLPYNKDSNFDYILN